jgi:hypothetical protein
MDRTIFHFFQYLDLQESLQTFLWLCSKKGTSLFYHATKKKNLTDNPNATLDIFSTFCIQTQETPKEWKKSITILLLKKGDPTRRLLSLPNLNFSFCSLETFNFRCETSYLFLCGFLYKYAS